MKKLCIITLCVVAVLVATNCGNKNVQQHNTEPISNEWSADSVDTLQRVVTESDSVENPRLLDSLAVAKADSIELAKFWKQVDSIRALLDNDGIIDSLIHRINSKSFINTQKVTTEDFALLYCFYFMKPYDECIGYGVTGTIGELIIGYPIILEGFIRYIKLVKKSDINVYTRLRDTLLSGACMVIGDNYGEQSQEYRGSQKGYDYMFYKIPESIIALYELPRERETIINGIEWGLDLSTSDISWTDAHI